MSNTKTEAQRMADWADDRAFSDAACCNYEYNEIADELRRLDAIEQARQALATTEPAVNQQLTTEPVADLSDDMGSLADYFGDMAQQKADLDASRGVSMPVSYYASTVVAAALAWQARAAMAQVGDINAVESFTNDTRDALMAGRAYAQEALIRFDDAYDRHPSTEPERNAILADIQLIDAAMAKGVK